MKQLGHTDTYNKRTTFPVTVLCDNLRTPENAGMVLRVCEAFGIETVVFGGNRMEASNRKLQKTARSTDKKISWSNSEDMLKSVRELRDRGYSIVSLEITDSSIPVGDLNVNKETPIALIIGSEVSGVSSALLEMSTDAVHIDMFGENSSMNVVTALSVALYEITGRLTR